MVESFIKLKKRAKKRAIALCLLFAFSAAAIVFGALFATVKLTKNTFPWYGYVGCALGAFLLVGGVLLLAIYPTTKRFAKTLDNKYALNEQVQTMVEYARQSGAILELQRENTEAALSSLPKQKKSFWYYLKMTALPVLAVATVSASIAIPNTQPVSAEKPEPPFVAERYQLLDLEALIENVRASRLYAPLKTEYLAELESLQNLLKEGKATQAQVKDKVIGVMTAVISDTKNANTYNAFVSAINDDEVLVVTMESFAGALKGISQAHTSIKSVDTFEYATLENTEGVTQDFVEGAIAAYTLSLDTAISGTKTDEEYISLINSYAQTLEKTVTLPTIATLDVNDGIIFALNNLRTDIQGTTALLGTGGYQLEYVQQQAGTVLEGFISDICVSAEGENKLDTQAFSVLMKEHVLNKLTAIFGYARPNEDSDGENGGGGGGGGTENPPDDGPGPGTPGPGGTLYPDDGLVLDPEDGQYKPYYLLVNNYYQSVSEFMNDKENKVPEDLQAYIKAYFEALINPPKADEE